ITLLHAIAGNYLPAFETATQFSVQVEAQSLASTNANANASATANHPTTLLIQNPQAPGAPTLPMTYSVTSAALIASGAPFPFSATTFSYLTATPPSLTAQLRATAQAWAGHATDAQSEAIAIQAAMQRQVRLTPINPRVTGVASVQTLLTTHRGDAFAWDTTYALLLRALGVPTRLMEGLLPGAYDSHTAEQVVRQSSATYWPQVAVDGSAWLTFDPTATVLPVSSATQTTNGGKGATGGTGGAHPGTHSGAHPAAKTPQRQATPPVPRPLQPLAHAVGATGAWLLVVALALVILCATLLIWRTTVRRQATSARRVARPIRRLIGWARLLGVQFAPGETTQQALARIAHLSARPGAPADVSTTVTARRAIMSSNAGWLAGEYNRAVYALHPAFEVATVARTDRLTRAFGIALARARLRGFAHPLADASAPGAQRPFSPVSPVSFISER
ncbi:MAG TPA: transglutaminase domain-containing protein, partial [Ktedonobacterales bacterium]|nr:transglutaminase domain-containing protein [Ktedonobacterales bacterium]